MPHPLDFLTKCLATALVLHQVNTESSLLNAKLGHIISRFRSIDYSYELRNISILNVHETFAGNCARIVENVFRRKSYLLHQHYPNSTNNSIDSSQESKLYANISFISSYFNVLGACFICYMNRWFCSISIFHTN